MNLKFYCTPVFFIPYLFAGIGYYRYARAGRELTGSNSEEISNTSPSESSVLQNLPPDRNRDPLRRPGEKLSGLCPWNNSLFVVIEEFDRVGVFRLIGRFQVGKNNVIDFVTYKLT